jgi:hypothetical protein
LSSHGPGQPSVSVNTSPPLAWRLAAKVEPNSPLGWEYRLHVRPSCAASWILLICPPDRSFFLGETISRITRGRRFGTILVNLETRRVVDLLPDRKAETAASWMYQHPDLMAVSRDRGGEYAAAATAGAPLATEYAERFHVMKNLEEALEGLLARHLTTHRKKEAQASDELAQVWLPKSTKRTPKLQQLQQARREERLARVSRR